MNTKTHILLLEYLKMQLMKLLVEEMAVSVKTVATVHSSCKTETHAADEIQCNERRVLSPEQVEVETELDCSVLNEQLYSPTFNMQEGEYALSKDVDVALWIDYRTFMASAH